VKWLIQLIDQDLVASLNSGRRAANLKSGLGKLGALALSLYAPRLTWAKLIAPLCVMPVPLIFLPEPAKTYWAVACLTAVLAFFALYFYRYAVIQQRWLDKHQVDQFGACNASPDDLYEVPSD
jgi:hypothetical protein